MSASEALGAAMRRLLDDCPEIAGVLLATPEGLLLASCGPLGGELAAAAATQLADVLDSSLDLVLGGSCDEALIWTKGAPMGIARMPTRHVAAVQGVPACRANVMRLALGRLMRDVREPLSRMTLAVG